MKLSSQRKNWKTPTNQRRLWITNKSVTKINRNDGCSK